MVKILQITMVILMGGTVVIQTEIRMDKIEEILMDIIMVKILEI